VKESSVDKLELIWESRLRLLALILFADYTLTPRLPESLSENGSSESKRWTYCHQFVTTATVNRE